MKALIFAAGLGTRLKPLTDTMPKALVEVGGKPLLYHVAHKIIDAGIDEIVVNAHHFSGMIVDYISSEHQFGVSVKVSLETERPLETGGGVMHAREFLEGCGDFLVHNVDIISDLDLRWFLSQVQGDALATLLVSERETSRYLLFDSGMRLVGWTNVRTGEVRSPFPALDPATCRKYAFSGIHCMSDRIFAEMEAEGEPECFPIMDFYLSVAARCCIRGVVAQSLILVDVGKTGAIAEAKELLSL